MNPGQKRLLWAILAYFLVWNSRYFWEYLPGLFDLGITLLLFFAFFVLAFIGLYQLFMLISEQPKVPFRGINVVLIVSALLLSYLKPLGLIDFQKLEGRNLLYAVYKGAANCSTLIKLKEGNRVKKTSICFGVNHYWGTYEVSGDSIRFHYDEPTVDNKAGDYGVLEFRTTTSGTREGFLYYFTEGGYKRGLPLFVREVDSLLISP